MKLPMIKQSEKLPQIFKSPTRQSADHYTASRRIGYRGARQHQHNESMITDFSVDGSFTEGKPASRFSSNRYNLEIMQHGPGGGGVN